MLGSRCQVVTIQPRGILEAIGGKVKSTAFAQKPQSRLLINIVLADTGAPRKKAR